MNVKGIRISNKERRVVIVNLPDILIEINNGKKYFWSILYLYACADLGENKSISEFEKQINESENGLLIDWDELNSIGNKFYQIYDIIIIASKDTTFLHRYQNDQEMYETCDIVIEMIDCGFWQVLSKDIDLINRLASKFKDIK